MVKQHKQGKKKKNNRQKSGRGETLGKRETERERRHTRQKRDNHWFVSKPEFIGVNYRLQTCIFLSIFTLNRIWIAWISHQNSDCCMHLAECFSQDGYACSWGSRNALFGCWWVEHLTSLFQSTILLHFLFAICPFLPSNYPNFLGYAYKENHFVQLQ